MHDRRRPARLAGAVAVVVAAATGCSAVSTADVGTAPASAPALTAPASAAAATVTTTTLPALPAGAPGVFVVGDSLTVGTEPWLAAAVAARGWRLTGVDARVGRAVPEGLRVLRRRQASLPGTVVVALGTNDLGASALDVDGWMATARRIVGGARRLVWVNLSLADHRSAALDRYRGVNAALAAAAARWRVDLLDWDAWAHRHAVTTKADGIHYEDGVYRLRALFYAAALPRVTAP